MYYYLNKDEANKLAAHFSYLIGESFYGKQGLRIDKIVVVSTGGNEYQVNLNSHVGSESDFAIKDIEFTTGLWFYLTNNNIQFNPEDIGLHLRKEL